MHTAEQAPMKCEKPHFLYQSALALALAGELPMEFFNIPVRPNPLALPITI